MDSHNNHPAPESVRTLRDYSRIFFRHVLLIAVSVMAVAGTVFVGVQLKTPVYVARTKMLISAEKQVQATYYRELDGSSNSKLVLTQSEIVNSAPVLERVINALNLHLQPLDYEKKFASPLKAKLVDEEIKRLQEKLALLPPEERQTLLFRRTMEDLRERISVQPVRDTNVFTISVSDYDPVRAAVLANLISRSYVIFDLEQQLAELTLKYGDRHPKVRQLKDNIEEMMSQLNGAPLNNLAAIGPASVKIIEQAYPPIGPQGSPRTVIIALGIMLGLVLGIILAFMAEYLNQTVTSPAQLQSILAIPFLGSIPKRRFLENVLIRESRKGFFPSAYRAAYRNICDQIRVMINKKNIKSILWTSSQIREGTTTAVVNLGFYLSRQAGKKVLLMDANFRDPRLHKIFHLRNNAGFTNLLEGQITLEEAAVEVSPMLWVIPAGRSTTDPAIYLDSPKMQQILEKAQSQFDIVIFDCADLRHRDAMILGPLTDGVFLIVSENKTRRQVLNEVTAPLKEDHLTLLGTILNNREFVIPKFIYNRL